MSASTIFHFTETKSGHLFRRTWTLTVVDGPDLHKSTSYDRGTGVLGAANASILRLTDDTVSRYHAGLEFSPEGVYVRDLDSTNGTFFNDARVQERFVEAGQRFRLGHTEIQISANDEDIETQITELAKDPNQLWVDLPQDMIAESDAFRKVLATARLAAHSRANILLIGAKGTGKSELARWIHKTSKRGTHPILTITVPRNASAAAMNVALFGVGAKDQNHKDHLVGPGFLERASGGSLFIENIERLSPSTRNQLRSTIQTGTTHRLGESEQRRVDVRLITASTQQNLVAAGLGANALKHIASIQLRIPDLTQRQADLHAFAAQTLATSTAPPVRIGPRFQKALSEQHWPQNLDSLRTTLTWLHRHPLNPNPLQQARIADMVELSQGDVTEIAKRFGVSTRALLRYMSRHNLDVDTSLDA